MSFKMFDEISDIALSGSIIGLAVGASRALIIERHGSFKQWFREVLGAILVATLVALGMDGISLTVATKGALIGTSAYVSTDLLTGLNRVARMIANDPIEFALKLVSTLRGQSRTTTEHKGKK
jgi:hypothetical protein